jgi:hypothetical protein
MSELRENLRRLIVIHITSSGYTVDELTDAAIALVRDAALEEAAKVCLHEIEQPFDEWSSGYKDGCEESAAAIRAMKERT